MTGNSCFLAFEEPIGEPPLAAYRRGFKEPLNNRQEIVIGRQAVQASGFWFLLVCSADGGFGGLEADAAVGAVAKGFVDRTAATAKRKVCFAREVVLLAVGIHEFDRAFGGFHAERSVFSCDDFDLRHAFLRGSASNSIERSSFRFVKADPSLFAHNGRVGELPRDDNAKDSGSRTRVQSILGHGRIDFVRPGQDAALEIPYFAETGLLQKDRKS